MNTVSQTVKICAYGLAYFLAFTIIASIVATVVAILSVVGIVNGSAKQSPIDCDGYEKCLSISLSFSELEITSGQELSAKAEDSKVEINQDGDKLVIKDAKKGLFSRNSDRKITVTIPDDMVFDVVGIGNKGGKVSVEKLAADEVYLNLGAGEVVFDYLTATERAKIDAGVGKLAIKDGGIKDGDIHLGIGEASITSALTGYNKVDAGIGAVNLDLLLPESEYTIKADKGIGQILFNYSEISDGSTIGSGKNYVEVDGGIGQIKISTADEIIDEAKEEKAESGITPERTQTTISE